MDNRPVIFLDSGIGSLPYAAYFHTRNPWEKLICVGDRANFPYGPKSKETLIDLVLSLAGKLIALYDPKIFAVVCNTASISCLSALRETFPLPIVGTVPAVKPAVLASKKRRIGVLGT
jgi:glutamate racemase